MAACIITSMLLGGCMLGPDPQRPVSVGDGAQSYVHADEGAMNVTPEEQAVALNRWWVGFADPATNELVERALLGNTDLRAAVARVMQARGALGVATGRRLPSVGASAVRNRAKSNFSLPTGRVETLDTTYDVGFDVSWQVDLFGRLRREQQAAWSGLLASEAAREAVLHSVIAEVVRTRIAIASLEAQFATQKANTASWEETYEVINRRYSEGLISPLEVRLAKENLAASRAAEPEFANLLARQRHKLDVLLGRQPGTGDVLPTTLPDLPDLEPVPVGLPGWLLDRRPDLKASEFRAAAATARIGAAIADLFPDLTISAGAGWRAGRPADLFDAKTSVYDLVLSLAWKVWAGGALRAQVDVNRAEAEEAAAEYAGLVLNAMREVEDALVRDHTAQQAYEQLVIRVEEARAAEELARQRYQRGVETIITVLETERRRRLAELELIQTRRVLWEARVSLYLALGGDWGVEAAQPTLVSVETPQSDQSEAVVEE
jgi:NodT family efflux transporter outer membrane factor (OMF) lipoprotein